MSPLVMKVTSCTCTLSFYSELVSSFTHTSLYLKTFFYMYICAEFTDIFNEVLKTTKSKTASSHFKSNHGLKVVFVTKSSLPLSLHVEKLVKLPSDYKKCARADTCIGFS